MNRKQVEAIRTRAINSLCAYAEPQAFVQIRAAQLEEVCDLALQQFVDAEEQMELAL